MSDSEDLYQNISKKTSKGKSSFLSFPWKSKNHVTSTSRKGSSDDRRRMVSSMERYLPEDGGSRGVKPTSSSPLLYNKDDSCTVGYQFNNSTNHSADNHGFNNEFDALDAMFETPDERRSRIFGNRISTKSGNAETTESQTKNRNTNTTADPSIQNQIQETTAKIQDLTINLYENIDDLASVTSSRADDGDCESNNTSVSSVANQVAVCEVKPTVRQIADDFKRERNKALIRRASSVKKTVTFNLKDQTSEYDTNSSSSYPDKQGDKIVILPQPHTGIMKHKTTQRTAARPDTLKHCDVDDNDNNENDLNRSLQLSPNGTSSDSGRDSFLSCCSECTCSSPSHYECQQPQCQSNVVTSPSSSSQQHEQPLYVYDDRMKYSTDYIIARLEDSILLAKQRHLSSASTSSRQLSSANAASRPLSSAGATPRRLEPGVTAKSAEYLNIDVAHSILIDSQHSDFATYKTKDKGYARIKGTKDISLAKDTPPALLPREKPEVIDKEAETGSRRVISPTHARPSKTDLLMMNRFHSYTLGDVMNNCSSLFEDVPDGNSSTNSTALKANTTVRGHAGSYRTQNDVKSGGNSSDLSRVNPDRFQTIRQVSNPTVSKHNSNNVIPQSVTSHSKPGDNTTLSQPESAFRQRYFLAKHKQRSFSDNSLMQPAHFCIYKGNHDKLVNGPKNNARNTTVNQQSSKMGADIDSRKAGSNQFILSSNGNSQNADRKYEQSRPEVNMNKHQAYVNKSKSWSCVPDNLRGSPYQAIFGRDSPSTQDSSQTRQAIGAHSRSPYVEREFPDVRWVGRRKRYGEQMVTGANLSKTVSRSEPTITWTASEMAEIFC